MEPLTLKPRQNVEDIECWDDDEDLQGIDDLNFRSASTTTTNTNVSAQTSQHRDSVSSRLSTRSDLDSNGGGDEDWQVLLPGDDESSTVDAIASAKSAGIPIPTNVPSSALLGGTIKRLGGRKLKKVLGDDWSEDLELPGGDTGGLNFTKREGRNYPDALRQISAAFKAPAPSKSQGGMDMMERLASAGKGKPNDSSLDKFRDEEEEDSFFGDVPTIRLGKDRSPQKPIDFTPPVVKASKDTDSFEEDLELPANGGPLKLSTRKEVPKTPVASHHQDDFDTEWAEGSLGTRFGGTKRDGRSNRSSDISALSPSVSSCLTAESEDEGLDGLVLPDGPLKFDEALKKRKENASPETTSYSGDKQPEKLAAAKEDFFSGIEIGDGAVFGSGKLTLNRNIKHKATRHTSPARRTATTLTFTNKPQSAPTKISTTRIPLPQRGHDRPKSTLESVSEVGGPVPAYRRPQSRLGGHSAQSSISSIPTPTTPSSAPAMGPSTPSRRVLGNKLSREDLRTGPTTTNAQLLRAKRSMPVMRSQQCPAKPPSTYNRPPSRAESGGRQAMPARPKTPVDRSGAESSLGNIRKPPVPFLPAGSAHSKSHHVSIKSSRQGRRPDSSDSNEQAPLRPISRLSNVHRPETPTGRNRKDLAPEHLAREAAAKRTITKPTRRRNFGDGNELEVFDDLPTSVTTESKFVKQPVGHGKPKLSLRSRLGQQSHIPPPSRTETPLPPPTPMSPTKQEYTPRFARDTNASRIAREQRTGAANVNPRSEGGPLATVSVNWKAQVAARGMASPSAHRGKKGKIPGTSTKPCLIKPIGDGVHEPKSIKGMHYNPILFRWEGNENALAPFDAPLPPPTNPSSPKSSPSLQKAAPALITNISATQGVQVVGGMVFDPQRMCWLKMAPQSTNGGNNNIPMSPDTVEDEEDPFAGLDDLEDSKSNKPTSRTDGDHVDGEEKRGGGLADEWLVGEEFDVGPEFVRRQRAEEEKWRRKVEAWVGEGRDKVEREREGFNGVEEWRWGIRVLAGEGR
ncbi:MAG: hypothetical protein M1830_010586 [Pleopsidium flavum]|nr:MAG: hypothetical protein M1830_010586 [Pleopsidium flavum]